MTYTFNAINGKKYILSLKGLDHIINGEFVVQPLGAGITRQVLKGGLHTKKGFDKFLNSHSKVAHLYNYNSKIHDDWFYARELQNDVIMLKLPRDLYSGNAASATLSVDKQYISGYLWKTLFPENIDEVKIVAYIDEALQNIDIENSNENQIIGYCNIQPDKTKIIRLMFFIHDGFYISSCFPTWTQPFTGNNGKAFSHKHTLSFPLVLSTVMIDKKYDRKNYIVNEIDDDFLNKVVEVYSKVQDIKIIKDYSNLRFYLNCDHTFNWCYMSDAIFSLILSTPSIFLEREIPEYLSFEKYEDNRIAVFNDFVNGKNIDNFNLILKYISSLFVVKFNHDISNFYYSRYFNVVFNNNRFFNSCNINENLIESMKLICMWDNKYSEMNFLNKISFILKNLVSFDFFDTIHKKRILMHMAVLCSEYHNPAIIKIFLENLVECPTRIELLKEYFGCRMSLNLIYTPKEYNDIGSLLDDIGLTDNLGFCTPDVIDFLKENLEENYIVVDFKDGFDNYLMDLIAQQHYYFPMMIEDQCRYFSDRDFISFSGVFKILLSRLEENNLYDYDLAMAVFNVVDEYVKIQIYKRKIINLLYMKHYFSDHEKAKKISFPLILNDENKYTICLFIERFLNSISSHLMCDIAISYFDKFNDASLKKKVIDKIMPKIGKDVPPNPSPLPDFIQNKLRSEQRDR